MKKVIQFCSVSLLIAFLYSCKGKEQAKLSKDSIKQAERLLHDSIAPNKSYKVITTTNAPTRITRKVRRDKEGNLLMAAFEDIIRYDGRSFSHFTKDPGLESFDAFDVLEDTKRNIWIASTHLGVFRYDGESFTNFTINDGLAHNRTMYLYEDKAGNIWICGLGGASSYDGISFTNFTTKEGLTHNNVHTIMEDKFGKFWIGTGGTACIYDPSTSTFTEIENNEGKPFENVWSIIEDKKGHIWISSRNGLWRYDGNSFTKLTSKGSNCVFEDKKGNIWFIEYTSGPSKSILFRYDEKALHNENPIAEQILNIDGTLWGIAEDKDDTIWLGGDDGVWHYNGKTISYFTGKNPTSK